MIWSHSLKKSLASWTLLQQIISWTLDPRASQILSSIRGKEKVLISFVAPTSNQSLTLRLKHFGREDMHLEVTLGSTIIQLVPSSKSSLTIDDITLYPTPGPSESDHLSFKPGWNDIVIQFGGIGRDPGRLLHDVELLDEAGLKDPRNQIINADWRYGPTKSSFSSFMEGLSPEDKYIYNNYLIANQIYYCTSSWSSTSVRYVYRDQSKYLTIGWRAREGMPHVEYHWQKIWRWDIYIFNGFNPTNNLKETERKYGTQEFIQKIDHKVSSTKDPIERCRENNKI